MDIYVPQSPLKPTTGFTLVELVVVIIIASILGVAAFSRLQDNSGFAAYNLRNQTIALLRDAQLRSMQDTRDTHSFGVSIDISSPSIALATSYTGFTPQNHQLISSTSFTEDGITLSLQNLATSAALSISSIEFSDLGHPNISDGVRMNFIGVQTVSICIESQGYIHACD